MKWLNQGECLCQRGLGEGRPPFLCRESSCRMDDDVGSRQEEHNEREEPNGKTPKAEAAWRGSHFYLFWTGVLEIED